MTPNKSLLENSRVQHNEKKLPDPKWTFEESKLLIASVKEQPELYDPQNSKYKLLKFTENLWANFDLLLKKPMGACKERWACLRSQFRYEHKENKDKSRWKLYSHMLFLTKFLYNRGPTLNECIAKAIKGQVPTVRKSIKIKEEQDSDRMITVLPDGIRDAATNSESPQFTLRQQPDDQTISMILHCEEEPIEPQIEDFTFRIPKLEPIEIENQFPHMSTPIVPRGQRVPLKRSLPDDIQIRKIKVQRPSESTQNSNMNTNETLKNVKLQKLSGTPSSSTYTLALNNQNGQQKQMECNNKGSCPPTPSQSNQMTLNQTMKPHEFPACSCTADADMMFMQSLVPDLKKLNSKQRMDFKVQVHQLLHSILYK